MKVSILLARSLLVSLVAVPVLAQETGGVLRGRVVDPTNAAIKGSHVTISGGRSAPRSVNSGTDGTFTIDGLAAARYTLTVEAPGFAPSVVSAIVSRGSARSPLTIHLKLAARRDTIQVTADERTVSTDPEQNANALILKGKDLDVLSDDPDEMLDELQALAGPSAGPNGGQIYIDGFTGGELPPKSAILEIRVNANPFSAQYERLGYGRIEIVTKPGTESWHGEIGAHGNDSAFNSRNPILEGPEPPYHSYDINGALSGPVGHHASFIVNGVSPNHQSTSVVSAIDPASLSLANPTGTQFSAAYNSPNSSLVLTPRVDLQLGTANVVSLRYIFSRASLSNQGIGETNLEAQAYRSFTEANGVQFSDAIVVTSHLADNLRVQYQHVKDSQTPADTSPQLVVQGAFTGGGNVSGETADHQDNIEFENNLTRAAGQHTISAGIHGRMYHDVNESTALENGSYTFSSTQAYITRTPEQYSVAVIRNPKVHLTLFDGAIYAQDDWRVRPDFTLSYGLRWETQNHIHDRSDWAPRVSLAWALPSAVSGRRKTVLRAGYGWFYQRFTVQNALEGAFGVPYLVTALHQNGVNQQVFTVTDPSGYTESSPGTPVKPPDPTASGSAPTIYSIDPHFHAALDMQAAVGIDRQIARGVIANVTYLYSRGVHQYLTNNIGAPAFPTACQNIYPGSLLPPASANRMQFQSGGVYRQDQIIASVNAHIKGIGLSGFYTYSQALGDTSGVSFVPSVAQDPALDYGRTSFDVRHRLMLEGSVTLPYQILFAPMFVVNSGVPYNITTGTDLTGNNQFNARPTFGQASACVSGRANYIRSPWGCLDANPTGTQETIVPYGLGDGPTNVALNARLSKSFGIGPREGSGGGVEGGGPPPPPGGGLGPGGLSGGGAAGPPPPAIAVPRRFNLSFSVVANNLLNTQNLGSPNGVLSAPASLRFHSQSLAGGPFSPPEGGNRSIFLETRFSF